MTRPQLYAWQVLNYLRRTPGQALGLDKIAPKGWRVRRRCSLGNRWTRGVESQQVVVSMQSLLTRSSRACLLAIFTELQYFWSMVADPVLDCPMVLAGDRVHHEYGDPPGVDVFGIAAAHFSEGSGRAVNLRVDR